MFGTMLGLDILMSIPDSIQRDEVAVGGVSPPFDFPLMYASSTTMRAVLLVALAPEDLNIRIWICIQALSRCSSPHSHEASVQCTPILRKHLH